MLENIKDLLKDKVIVISGGTKGVAKAVAIEAARQGADVVISGRDEAAAEKVLQEIENAGRRGLFVKLNLRNPEDCARLFEETMEKFGKVDGFLNYAGTTPANSLVDENLEQFDAVFDINVRAAFFCAQHAVRCMQKGSGGSIVMIGSPHAWCGQKDRAAYSVSKGALLTLTEHIAHHYAEDKIRANFVTIYDKKVQDFLTARLKEVIPDAKFLGEENGMDAFQPGDEEGWLFVIDPIDGTTNFIHNMYPYVTSIGLMKDGAPYAGVVYIPLTGQMFSAERGQGAYENGKGFILPGRLLRTASC